MDSSGEAVLYGSDESGDSTAMVDLLNELGVAFEYRSVNRDPVAMREWEQLDGERVPLLRMATGSRVTERYSKATPSSFSRSTIAVESPDSSEPYRTASPELSIVVVTPD